MVLKTIRSELGLTQMQAASLLEMRQSNYSSLETDKVRTISSKVFTALTTRFLVNPLFIQSGVSPVFVVDVPLISDRIKEQMKIHNINTAHIIALNLPGELIQAYNRTMANTLLPDKSDLERIFEAFPDIDVDYIYSGRFSQHSRPYSKVSDEDIRVMAQESLQVYKKLLERYEKDIEQLNNTINELRQKYEN